MVKNNFRCPKTGKEYFILYCRSSIVDGKMKYYERTRDGYELLVRDGYTLEPIPANEEVPRLAIKTGDGSKV